MRSSPAPTDRIRRPPWAAPALAALLVFTGLGLRAGSADSFRFLVLPRPGADWARPGVLLPGQRAEPGAGYDGQFYFYLAQDPMLSRPDTAASLDNTFRVRRILYPLVAWALSGGRRELVPYTLVVVNVLAVAGLAALGAAAAARAGRSPWWGCLPLLYAGTWIPVVLDLTEPLQLALLAAAFTTGSALLLLGATVAKETAGVALFTEMAGAARRQEWGRAARYAGVLALFLAWAGLVFTQVHGPRFSELGAHFLDPPGAPLLALRRGPLVALVTLPAVLVCVGAIARLAAARDRAAWAAAAYATVALGAGSDTWTDPAAFYRVTAGVVVLVFLSWTGAGDLPGRITLYVAAATAALAVILA